LVEGAGDAIQSIGDIAESAVREVGHAVESVGREVGKVGQTAINDPVGTIAKVAAVASGQWWALPLVSAGLVIANGGDIGKAALAAGISLAAQGVAYGVGEALGSAGSGISDMIGQDAASLAEQGLSNSQIADVLAQSYPELASEVISQTADLASMGFTGAQIASDLGSSYGAQFAAEAITPSMQNALANIAANTGGSGVRAALSGGDLNDVLTAMGTAGLGTAVGAGTSTGLQQTGLNSGISNTLGAATGATAAAAASGKDGTSAFINSLINTTLREAGQQSKAYLKQAWDKVKTSVDEYNTQLTKTNDTQTSLVPLEKAAKDAETAVNAELEAYKPVRQRFSDLVSQYDAAKAAGNVELANSLADQANAMIPELNAATEKYNSAYANYETKLNTYSTAVEGYKTEIAKTDELKAGYEKNSVALGDETKKLSEAASKVVTMAEPVQNAFAKMYQSGTDVDTALENSNKLNGMTTIAQEAFNRDIATSNSADTALEFANKINSLDTKQQSAFQTGITTGLDNAKAFEIAPVISSYNPNQQQAYAGAVKQGYGQEGADLISAFASFAPEKTTSAPATSITPTTRDVASEFVKLNPLAQDVYKELIDTGMKPTEALDAIKQATTESGSPDGGKTIYITGVGSSGDPELDAKLAEEAAAKITAGVYGGGTADPLSSIKSMFGSGATGNVELPALFAFGTKDQQDQAIQYLDDIIKDPTATPEQVAKANQTLQKVKGSKVAGGGGGGGGTSGTSTTTTAPTTAPTTTTGGGQAGSGETTPTNITPPDASFTGTGTTGTGTTTTAPKAGTPTTTAGTGTGTGGGAGTGTGTGTGSGTGTGTGTGTGSGSGSGSGAGTGAGIGLGIGAATLGSGYGGWQALQSQDQYGGIKNLTPGLTERVDYTLSGLPKDEDQDTVNPMSDAPKYAGGGSAVANTYDPYSTKDVSGSGISGSLTPGLSKAQINYILTGLPGHAEGGSIEEEHNPSFFSEGGLGSIDNRYVKGEGDGTSDSVAAMLANGEFVIPADVVSKLGNGSNEAGAGVLDQFLMEIRKHANSNGVKLPPESKGPLGYLLDAKRKVKA
jgi:hypothetical protein